MPLTTKGKANARTAARAAGSAAPAAKAAATDTKAKDTKAKDAKAGTQAPLLPPPAGPFKQKDITGKTNIKATASKQIQETAEYWFGKKRDLNIVKNRADVAAEKLTKLMDADKITSVVVFDSDLQKKVRVNLKQGAEKLSVSRVTVE